MEDWIAIVLFLCTAACIIVPFYLRYLTRVKRMDTIIKLAENGGEVKAEMIKMLGYEGGPTNDMRKGLVFIAISLPTLLGFMLAGKFQMAAFIGGIPLCVGLAYLAVMKYGYNNNKNERDTL